MKKFLHIIPGWEDDCSLESYQKLAERARQKDYEIEFHNVDWKSSLSEQLFPVAKDDTVLGFSLGAILAWLVSQKYECEKLILASMTPHHSFSDSEVRKALVDLTGETFVNDIIENLNLSNRAKTQIVMYGNQEEEPGDILVPDTGHELTKEYIEEISRIL